jgi:hypothetical protein
VGSSKPNLSLKENTAGKTLDQTNPSAYNWMEATIEKGDMVC